MRLKQVLIFLTANLLAISSLISTARAQRPPDASPTTPVETLSLANFEPTREEAVLEAYIDGVVAAHMRQFDTPGVTVSVVKDGRLLFAKGYGLADIASDARVDGRETLFRIGSITKTFVWVAAMMLAERGVLDLDTDVNLYLKDMEIPDAFDAPVTMNHLMAHRAGFEDTIGLFMIEDDSTLTLTEALKAEMPKRVNPPGTRSSYSNWGAALAAKIVEDVAGEPFIEFLQREMLDPLAMDRSTLLGPMIAPEPFKSAFATGYKVAGGDVSAVEPMQIGPFAPAGAMGAPASDMAQWMLLLLGDGAHNGVRLYSDETARLMRARAFDDRAAGDVAHGFFTKDLRGVETHGHGGSTTGFRSYMEIMPELGVGVFVSQNTTSGASLPSALGDLIINRLTMNGLASRGALAPDQATAYTGTFVTNRRSFSRFETLFGTGDSIAVTPGSNGGLLVVASYGAREYWPMDDAADTFISARGARVSFGRDASGRVTHISSGPQSYERMSGLGAPDTFYVAAGVVGFFAVTTLLGAWRRQGRAVAQTAAGRVTGLASIALAIVPLAFFASAGATVATMMDATPSTLLNYPSTIVWLLRLTAYATLIAGVVAAFSLYPAWTRSGWSIWRKSHYTVFALALLALAALMVKWKLVFAPFSGLG